MGVSVELRQTDGSITPQGGFGDAAKVTPVERPGVVTNREQAASTTRATLTFGTGLNGVTLMLSNASGALYVHFVFNADNDADAIAKIASGNSRLRVPIGESITLTFPTSALCTRIDMATNAGTVDVTLLGVAGE